VLTLELVRLCRQIDGDRFETVRGGLMRACALGAPLPAAYFPGYHHSPAPLRRAGKSAAPTEYMMGDAAATASRALVRLTAFLYLGGLAPGYAGELPDDIWNGNRGGLPSVTTNRSGVSVTLPAQAVADAGGGELAAMVEDFLNRWAPEICTDLFDFQHPHQRMNLRVAVHGEGPIAAYQDVIIDYRPSHQVKCIEPDNLVY
jgi:hypothetical protein